ncbi:MAG: hypothetical protein J1E40_04615 [Oscillospiraceae bacterium]|nr:hypothetical protein [Oscillospiraceae bacterium]
MEKEIKDITEYERWLLASLKKRPGMYLGKTSLTNFVNWSNGYGIAMSITNNDPEHNILPDGLHDYAAMKYLGHTETSYGWFSLILQKEPDEEKAFYIFFEMLDEYLVSLGYEPIPEWEDIKDKLSDYHQKNIAQKRGDNNA